MARFVGILLLVALAPSLGRGQETPEDLLPAGTQVYLRWDGVDAHRQAFDKTALGQMMKGDTGKFVTNAVNQVQDSLSTILTVDQFLRGFSPARLRKLRADAGEAPKLMGMIGSQGLVLGIEVRKLEPPEAQATMILPGAGAKPEPLFATLRLIAGLSGVEIKEVKIDGRAVHHLDAGFVHVAAWAQGKHALLSVGTDAPATTLKRLSTPGARLTGDPLFQRVQGFKGFETSARAFLDVASLVKLGQTRGKGMAQLLDDFGLTGLRSAVLYSGFDGEAERGLMEFDTTGPRKGILRLVTGKPFRLSDVPAMPQDATSWSMTNFDLGRGYDLAWTSAEGIFRLLDPQSKPPLQEFRKQVDDALGIDLRNDFLGALDDKFAMYSSPADGPLNFGQTFLFKVKDPAKLQESLSRALKNLGRITGTDIAIKQRTYHGVEIHEVHVRQQGFFFVPTYTIHKGWLAFSYFPQAVQGYVLRATGELPAWKPDARTQAFLDRMPKEFISISVTDPRPTVKQILALSPLVGGMFKSFFPDIKFDVGTLPNSDEATQKLFPNVAVVTSTETMIRSESRSSLELPFDLGGLDYYALLAVLFGFGRFAFVGG
jgi:hypothetical protein